MIEDLPSLISTLGFPIAVCCVLLWLLFHFIKNTQEAHQEALEALEKVIKVHLINAINDLKMEIVRLNERCNNGGNKKT